MLLPFGVSNQPGEFLIFSTGVVNHVIICDNVIPYDDMTTVQQIKYAKCKIYIGINFSTQP